MKEGIVIKISIPEELQGVRIPDEVLRKWLDDGEREYYEKIEEMCREEVNSWMTTGKTESTVLDSYIEARWQRVCCKWRIKHK